MLSPKKTIRYYYWVVVEFTKKHLRLILLSFLLSFIFVIGIISLSPYFENLFASRQEIIGLAGQYDFNNLPDEVLNKISNGLVYVDEKGEIIPVLSTSWEVKDGGKVYRFHLRDGLLWNNGKPFSANQIDYQFKDVEAKAIDAKTIDFILKKPLGIFPTYLSKVIIRYPLIGVAGLYRVNDVKTQYGNITTISLEPNKKDIPAITYKFYTNESDLVTAYKKGEVTQISTTKKSIADTFTGWKNTKVIKSIDYTRLMTLFFNLDNNFLKDKDVRNAIISAIDLSKFTGDGEIAKGPIPPTSWAYNPNLQAPVYDRDNASKILRKAGSASKSAQLNLITYYDYYDIADQLVHDLSAAGLKVSLNIVNYDKPNNFDMLLSFWKVPLDPDQYYFWHSTQQQGNISNYKNVKIDKLLEDGRSTIILNDRKNIYFEFQKVIQDDSPAVFLYYPSIYTIERK